MNTTTFMGGGQNWGQCRTEQQKAMLPTLTMSGLHGTLYTTLSNDLGVKECHQVPEAGRVVILFRTNKRLLAKYCCCYCCFKK